MNPIAITNFVVIILIIGPSLINIESISNKFFFMTIEGEINLVLLHLVLILGYKILLVLMGKLKFMLIHIPLVFNEFIYISWFNLLLYFQILTHFSIMILLWIIFVLVWTMIMWTFFILSLTFLVCSIWDWSCWPYLWIYWHDSLCIWCKWKRELW